MVSALKKYYSRGNVFKDLQGITIITQKLPHTLMYLESASIFLYRHFIKYLLVSRDNSLKTLIRHHLKCIYTSFALSKLLVGYPTQFSPSLHPPLHSYEVLTSLHQSFQFQNFGNCLAYII